MNVFQSGPSGLVLVVPGEASPPHRCNAELDGTIPFPNHTCTVVYKDLKGTITRFAV